MLPSASRARTGIHAPPAVQPALPAVVFALLLVPASALAQYSVSVVPDRTSLAMGETLGVTIVIKGRVDSIEGPDISDFDVVGRSTSTSVSIVNGSVQQEQRILLTLSPRRPGRLTIGKVELVAASRVVASSKPVTITVGGSPPRVVPGKPSPRAAPNTAPGPPPPRPSSGKAGARAFMEIRCPRRTLYEGEPIYVEYVVYTRSDLPVTEIGLESNPNFKGFVVETIPLSRDESYPVRVGRVPYNARPVWKGVLTALKEGEIRLPDVTAVLLVGDFFSQRRYRLGHDPMSLTFEHPPADGMPADYVEGTVGRFLVKASLDRNEVRPGESALLTVEVSGSGNLRGIRQPKLDVDEGVRVSPVPTSDLDEIVVDRGGVSGKRVFQYLLTPQHPGKFRIGRIDLPFFDPITQEYGRTRTEPLVVTAVGGGGPGREELPGREDQVVTIITESDLEPTRLERHDIRPSRAFYAFLAVPFVFFLGAGAWSMKRKGSNDAAAARARRGALKKAMKRIHRIEAVTDPVDFWTGVDRVIRDYLEDRFSIPARAMGTDEIHRALIDIGIDASRVDSLCAELESCAFGRFAPSATQERDRGDAIGRVAATLEKLDGGAA